MRGGRNRKKLLESWGKRDVDKFLREGERKKKKEEKAKKKKLPKTERLMRNATLRVLNIILVLVQRVLGIGKKVKKGGE